LPDGGFWLLLAGGLCYTVGLLLNLQIGLPYHRTIRRAFVLGGSACHVLAVLLFVLPGAS
jgi:hemolysin III